jgi:hypothetical protein
MASQPGDCPPKKRVKTGDDDDQEDRVVSLDVGGTIFKTNRSTLTLHSAYFKAIFSAEWKQHTTTDNAIFLDHDPSVFASLLSFMRYGSIHAEKVSKEVLILAEYLKVDDLVAAAKCIYMRSKKEESRMMSDEEAIAAFDQTLASFHAIPNNELTSCIMRHGTTTSSNSENDISIDCEYAALYLHSPHKDFPKDIVDPPYRAGVLSLRSPSPPDDGYPRYPGWEPTSDSFGFFLPIYALNWLGMHGFELLAPEALQAGEQLSIGREAQEAEEMPFDVGEDEINPAFEGAYMGHILFIKRPNAAGAPSIADIIIQQASSQPTRSRCTPREYATLNTAQSMNGVACIQYAGGDAVSVPRRLGDGAMRNVGQVHCTNIVAAMDLLKQHGFTTREPKIEKFLTMAQTLRSDGFFDSYTMVFSRPLCEALLEQPPRLREEDLIPRQLFHDWVQEPTPHGYQWRRLPHLPLQP